MVHWPGEETTARVLAEAADRNRRWPGIAEPWVEPVTLLLAADESRFDSLTRGRLPDWGVGAALLDSNLIVLRLTRDVRSILRHEMAHLALYSVVQRAPLWFHEGYAAYAAGEWGRLRALRVNWALLTGGVPSFGQVNRDIRSGAGHAEVAYALATTAVLYLERIGGEQGLGPLMTNLEASQDLDSALRVTHQITLGQLEALWQRDLRKRYGWAVFFGSLTVFWAVVAILLLSLWGRRRRRNAERRASLDQNWVV